jgi:hypothetical protein
MNDGTNPLMWMASCSPLDLAKIGRSSKISSWIWSIISRVRAYQHLLVCVFFVAANLKPLASCFTSSSIRAPLFYWALLHSVIYPTSHCSTEHSYTLWSTARPTVLLSNRTLCDLPHLALLSFVALSHTKLGELQVWRISQHVILK